MFLTHCETPIWFWEILLFNFLLFCSVSPPQPPPNNSDYLLIVSLCKDYNDFISDFDCVLKSLCFRERETGRERGLGYQCSTRALEILPVAQVTARIHSGEYIKKEKAHANCACVCLLCFSSSTVSFALTAGQNRSQSSALSVKSPRCSLTFVSAHHSAAPFTTWVGSLLSLI